MLFLCNFLIVIVLFLNNHFFAFSVSTCNMKVGFFMLCNFFVSENYLSAKNKFL